LIDRRLLIKFLENFKSKGGVVVDSKNFKRLLLLSLGIIVFCVMSTNVLAKKSFTEAEKKAKALAEAKETLNNTTWDIVLKSIVASKKKSSEKEDTLRFINNQVVSDDLESDGFSPSNYTIRLKGKDNDVIIWETMQTSEDKGAAFWRGEIRNGKMRGVLSRHISNRKKESYNFSSVEKKVVPEKIEVEETVVEESKKGGEEAAVNTAAEENKKNKKK